MGQCPSDDGHEQRMVDGDDLSDPWDINRIGDMIVIANGRLKRSPVETPDPVFHDGGSGLLGMAIPAGGFGPWWMAAQIFIRWARLGVWERLLALVQERGIKLGMVFLDGTNIRAHQKAAGITMKGRSE
jgi:hypothetical protein